MSYKLQIVSASVYKMWRGRALIGRITYLNGSWHGRVTRNDEVYTASSGSVVAVFEELVRQLNRVALGVDRHDAEGAHAAIRKRSEEAHAETIKRNAELDKLGVTSYRWGMRRRRKVSI